MYLKSELQVTKICLIVNINFEKDENILVKAQIQKSNKKFTIIEFVYIGNGMISSDIWHKYHKTVIF